MQGPGVDALAFCVHMHAVASLRTYKAQKLFMQWELNPVFAE